MKKNFFLDLFNFLSLEDLLEVEKWRQILVIN